MVVLAPREELTPDLLPPEMSAAGAAGAPIPTDRPLKEAVSEFKREYIRAALASCGGNQTKAAERLGLQRTFLNRIIKELGI